jgi:hypothetical protein
VVTNLVYHILRNGLHKMGTNDNVSIVISRPMMYVYSIFNISKTPDDDHMWSKHVVSMLSE